MKRNDAKRRWRFGVMPAVAMAIAVGALVLAGCGGSSGGGSTGTTTSSGETDTQGKGNGGFAISEEAQACLKEKGVELPEMKNGGPPGETANGEMPEPPEGGELPENGEPPEGFEPPEGGEGGPPQGGFNGEMGEEQKKAFEECGVEMPEFRGGPGGRGGPNVNSAAFKKQVKEYVACVRENGYELAEPDFSGEGPIFEKSESESAAFKKASAKCQSLLGGTRSSESG